ncbi:hypothetical protein BB558_000920 [Smittium angustum]|uniref:Metaxin glutathione S-transferase domain-containing protein n=1 Tax=Smittium angustum TaxID=133377 RepID=A0A2U1JD31_SMIAN|nr:hypothetical protein BB558_000920 [Smittium angustum]
MNKEEFIIDQTTLPKSLIEAHIYENFISGSSIYETLDPESLALVTYLKFTDAKWGIKKCRNPSVSPSGELPFIRDEGDICEMGLINSFKYLRNLMFEWYSVPENFNKSIRPSLSKYYGAPLGNFKASSLRDQKVSFLESKHNWYCPTDTKVSKESSKNSLTSKSKDSSIDIDSLKKNMKNTQPHKAYDFARKYLNLLEIQLGDQEYFLDNMPTSLDAIAYGYLSLITKVDLIRPTLKTIISLEFPKLVSFVDRMEASLYDSQLGGIGSENSISSSVKCKSRPVSISEPDPNSISDFAAGLVHIISPWAYDCISSIRSRVSKLKLNDNSSSSNYPSKTLGSGPISPSQFILSSVIVVVGFITANRIFLGNMVPESVEEHRKRAFSEDEGMSADEDRIFDEIGSSKQLLSGLFGSDEDNILSHNQHDEEFSEDGESEIELDLNSDDLDMDTNFD